MKNKVTHVMLNPYKNSGFQTIKITDKLTNTCIPEHNNSLVPGRYKELIQPIP